MEKALRKRDMQDLRDEVALYLGDLYPKLDVTPYKKNAGLKYLYEFLKEERIRYRFGHMPKKFMRKKKWVEHMFVDAVELVRQSAPYLLNDPIPEEEMYSVRRIYYDFVFHKRKDKGEALDISLLPKPSLHKMIKYFLHHEREEEPYKENVPLPLFSGARHGLEQAVRVAKEHAPATLERVRKEIIGKAPDLMELLDNAQKTKKTMSK